MNAVICLLVLVPLVYGASIDIDVENDKRFIFGDSFNHFIQPVTDYIEQHFGHVSLHDLEQQCESTYCPSATSSVIGSLSSIANPIVCPLACQAAENLFGKK